MRVLIAVLSGVLVAILVYGLRPARPKLGSAAIDVSGELRGEVPCVSGCGEQVSTAPYNPIIPGSVWYGAYQWDKETGRYVPMLPSAIEDRPHFTSTIWDPQVLAEAKEELIRRGEVVRVIRPQP